MTAHLPVIRNDMVLLPSPQTWNALIRLAGKPAPQTEVLQTVQKVMGTGMPEKAGTLEGRSG